MSNLPPGVTDRMIPGNRPEDEAWDRYIELIFEKARALGEGMADFADDFINSIAPPELIEKFGIALGLPTFEDFMHPEPPDDYIPEPDTEDTSAPNVGETDEF